MELESSGVDSFFEEFLLEREGKERSGVWKGNVVERVFGNGRSNSR